MALLIFVIPVWPGFFSGQHTAQDHQAGRHTTGNPQARPFSNAHCAASLNPPTRPVPHLPADWHASPKSSRGRYSASGQDKPRHDSAARARAPDAHPRNTVREPLLPITAYSPSARPLPCGYLGRSIPCKSNAVPKAKTNCLPVLRCAARHRSTVRALAIASSSEYCAPLLIHKR